VLGIATCWFAPPRLSFSTKPPFRAGNIVDAFAIKNEGFLPAREVLAGCYISKLTNGGNVFADVGTAASGPFSFTPKLVFNDTMTIGNDFFMQQRGVTSIDLTAFAYYRPLPFIPWKIIKAHRFVRPEGATMLYEEPIGDMENTLNEDRGLLDKALENLKQNAK
jgi:hypothetical protein